MRLISMKIRNFRVLKAVDLHFGDQVIGIIGVNGSGKSSIVEAVSWALYGNQAARSGRDEIKSTFASADEDCEVSLEFSINEEKYRVERRLIGRSQRPDVQLFRGDASESVGVNETKRHVGELLGLDWRGFLTSFLARQQELNTLSSLQPAKRKEHLAGMLGIERLDRAVVKVKEDVKVAAGQIQVLERQMAEIDTIRAAIADLTVRSDKAAAAAEQAETAVGDARAAFDAATASYTEAQEVRSDFDRLEALYVAAVKTKAGLDDRLTELKTELSDLRSFAAEATELEGKLVRLPAARKELEVLQAARNRRELRDQLLRRVAELTAEKEQTDKRLAVVVAEQEQLNTGLADLPASLEADATAALKSLDEARDKYHAKQAERSGLEAQAAQLRKQMASITEFGPESVCDRCLRPLGDDLPGIRSHLQQELDALSDRTNRLDDDRAVLKNDGLRLKEAAAGIESRLALRREMLVRGQGVEKERQQVTAQSAEISGRLEQAQKQLGETGETAIDPVRIEAVVAEVAGLEKDHTRLSGLQGRLTRLEKVEAALSQTVERTATAATEMAVFARDRDGLGFSPEAFRQAGDRFQQDQKILDNARTAQAQAVRELEITATELEGKRQYLARLEKAGEELEQYRDNRFYGEKLGGLLTEFRGHLIARIRPTLAEFSSRLMSDMTDGRYTMVELDEKYNLRVLDSGQYYGVERFSGGEKDLANLCLRLAISEALTEAAGLNRSFVILDEVFGSQDEDRKELIIRGLTNLKHRFPQILLITHIADIKDRVETLIEVEPTGLGWSTVSTNGTSI